MKRNTEKTAAELMAELEASGQYQEQKTERERVHAAHEAAFEAAVRPILDELQNVGVTVSSIDELLEHHAPLSEEIVRVLLRGIRTESEPLQETLVRALAASNDHFEGRALVNLFEETSSEQLRWVIANTLAEARPIGVSEWVVKAATNPCSGKAREMLVLAVARMAPPEKAKTVLTALFEALPGHVAAAFAEIGGAQERVFLKTNRDYTKGWVRKEIDKAVSSITKRLSL